MGVSIENCKGGWDALVSFAQERDCQDKEAIVKEEPRRKGSRELQSLVCSINYENSNSRHGVGPTSSRGDRRSKRVVNGVS